LKGFDSDVNKAKLCSMDSDKLFKPGGKYKQYKQPCFKLEDGDVSIGDAPGVPENMNGKFNRIGKRLASNKKPTAKSSKPAKKTEIKKAEKLKHKKKQHK